MECTRTTASHNFHNLPDCVELAIKIFADDTKIYSEIKDQSDIK